MALNGIAHKNLTDPQLHELKGASTAAAGQLPFADGEGNTAWGDLTPDKIQISPEEIVGASTSSGTIITKLDLLGMPGTPSDTMTPAASFTGANQNTLNEADKINTIIDEVASLNLRYGELAYLINSLLEALKNLGFITVTYPR